MTGLPVPWWTFWLAAALVLYLGLIWFFVREATGAHQQPHSPEEDQEPEDPPTGVPRTEPPAQ